MDVSNKPYTPNTLNVYTAIDAVSGDTTSGAIDVSGAERIMIVFTEHATVLNRSGELTITVSVDGTNFYAYSMLISNSTNTNSQNLTRVASTTQAAAGTDILWMTPETLGGINYIKAVLDVTDSTTPSGTFTVEIAVQR